MKFEPGQIVCSMLSSGATWQFIIVGAFKNNRNQQYYKCYCFANPYPPGNKRDLHQTFKMREGILNAV